MEFIEPNSVPSHSDSSEKLLINKNEVLKVLNDLVEQYPSENIPMDVLEKSLAIFLEPRQSIYLKDNSAINKLDQILAHYKNINPS